jgi:putative CocE/NonD family hydrolase
VSDQRFAAKRPDVLVYQSEPLESDVTLAGPLEPHLFASTTGTDADWAVKLIDVYPDDFPSTTKTAPRRGPSDVPPPGTELGGFQQLVRGGPFRARYRNSFEQPAALTPEAVTEIRYTLPDVNHTFRRGHRIMVQVQSTWFPLVDRNPQTYVTIPTAKPEDFKVATQSLWRGPSHPSGINVRVLANPVGH